MESHPEESLIGQFLESLATEKGYSDHTLRAYGNDLEAFFSFIAESQASAEGRQKHTRAVSPTQIDGLIIRGLPGFFTPPEQKNNHCPQAVSDPVFF